MADEGNTKSGMAIADRHVYGPRPLGALVPRIARPAFRARGAGTGQVMADWEAIVGPMLAAVSAPRRLAAGTLTIACAGPVAMELQHYATELISRINTHLGSHDGSQPALRADHLDRAAGAATATAGAALGRRGGRDRGEPPCPRGNCAPRSPRLAGPCWPARPQAKPSTNRTSRQ